MRVSGLGYLCVLLAPLMAFSVSCSTISNNKANSACWQRAIYCAMVMSRAGHETSIVSGLLMSKNGDITHHAQARTKIDGTWKWLSMNGSEVEVGRFKSEFEQVGSYTIDEYLSKCKKTNSWW